MKPKLPGAVGQFAAFVMMMIASACRGDAVPEVDLASVDVHVTLDINPWSKSVVLYLEKLGYVTTTQGEAISACLFVHASTQASVNGAAMTLQSQGEYSDDNNSTMFGCINPSFIDSHFDPPATGGDYLFEVHDATKSIHMGVTINPGETGTYVVTRCDAKGCS